MFFPDDAIREAAQSELGWLGSGGGLRARLIDFGGANSFGNCGDRIGEVFHGITFRSPSSYQL
jgi:hypothetical protein